MFLLLGAEYVQKPAFCLKNFFVDIIDKTFQFSLNWIYWWWWWCWW